MNSVRACVRPRILCYAQQNGSFCPIYLINKMFVCNVMILINREWSLKSIFGWGFSCVDQMGFSFIYQKSILILRSNESMRNPICFFKISSFVYIVLSNWINWCTLSAAPPVCLRFARISIHFSYFLTFWDVQSHSNQLCSEFIHFQYRMNFRYFSLIWNCTLI